MRTLYAVDATLHGVPVTVDYTEYSTPEHNCIRTLLRVYVACPGTSKADVTELLRLTTTDFVRDVEEPVFGSM